MSHRDSKVDIFNGFDTQFSSGDSNTMQSKQHYREENNNQIDELSKNFTDMGCIVDAVKRPPNICVETCVFEDTDSDEAKPNPEENEDDAYSDEFEEGSDGEVQVKLKESEPSEVPSRNMQESSVKLSKSQSFMSTKAPASVSGISSNFGSVGSSARTRRVNMSFSNERLREIERHNHILLNKILSARNTRKSSIPAPAPREPHAKMAAPAAASVQRKRQQRQIDRDNMILLKKIQGAKSSSYSNSARR